MIIFKFHQIFELLPVYLPTDAVIVEAGAFDGLDTLRLAKAFPNGTIHSFEPVPILFDALKKKMEPYPRIHVYPYALSTQDDTAPLWLAERPDKPHIPSQASSLLEPKERLDRSLIQFPSIIQVPTITLDSWGQQYQVSQIDLLWLDVQGMELAIMKASPNLFKKVRAVFTEVAFIEGYATEPLYPDVVDWLSKQGFVAVGQDFDDKAQGHTFFGNVLFIRP